MREASRTPRALEPTFPLEEQLTATPAPVTVPADSVLLPPIG